MGRTSGNIVTFIFTITSPTMGRTSGNIVTFIFIMMVTNNGKNKW
jgi:hypothetical protein